METTLFLKSIIASVQQNLRFCIHIIKFIKQQLNNTFTSNFWQKKLLNNLKAKINVSFFVTNQNFIVFFLHICVYNDLLVTAAQICLRLCTPINGKTTLIYSLQVSTTDMFHTSLSQAHML